MEPLDPALSHDDWTRHVQALRRLAAGLVRDAGEAEDLVQETWLRGRAAPGAGGPWLRTVLRNLARDRARGRARRAWTEREAARPEPLPSSDEVVARLEVAQRVAQEVAALDEPLRLVLHLRYFEDQSPEAIARRLGSPLETVRTRLKRGLAALRARMDRAHDGDRRAWLSALVALVPEGSFPPPSTGPSLSTATATLSTLMGTKLLLGAATVLVVAGTFFWPRKGTEPRSATPAPAPSAEISSTPALTVPPRAAEEARRSAPATPPPVLAAAPEPSVPLLHGRVVVVDERGEEHAAESGRLTLIVERDGNETARQEVEFQDGGFSLPHESGAWLVVSALVAGGRGALLPHPERIVPEGELLVRGRWLPRGRLRVLDADLRLELDGIEVRCAEGWRANPEWTHPGGDSRLETVIAGGTSPVELPERLISTPYWVHAPGHAWTRVDFDHHAGGERTVLLDARRGALEAVIDGPLPADAFVRLYPAAEAAAAGSDPVARRARVEGLWSFTACLAVRVQGGVARAEDFAPGTYVAALETGEYEERRVLDVENVEIVDGGLARVRLVADDPSALPRTHLVGTVRVPEGLALADCTLVLTRLEGGETPFLCALASLPAVSEDGRTLAFDAGERRTGSYTTSISRVQHRELHEVPRAGGVSEIHVEIPTLVEVTVEVTDADTGALLEPERLQWADGEVDWFDQTTLASVVRGEDGTYRFVAPQGPVRLFAKQPGYREESLELDLVPPRTEARLELRRVPGIRVEFHEGQATLPVGHEILLAIEVLDRDGNRAWTQGTATDSTLEVELEHPGRYRVVFPPVAGFRPVEDRTVDVEAGAQAVVVVQAEREP